jgi:hypothetical protein
MIEVKETGNHKAIFFVQLLASPYFFYTRNRLNIRWRKIKTALIFDLSRFIQDIPTEKPSRNEPCSWKTPMVRL